MKMLIQLALLVACLLLDTLAYATDAPGVSRSGTTAETRGQISKPRAPAKPGAQPSGTIVLPPLVVNEALLDRLYTQPAQLPRDLSPDQRIGLDAVARHIKAGNMGAAQAQWRNTLGSYVSGSNQGSNIMAMLYFVMKESIKDQNEDKKYYLQKLKNRNDIADALAEQLKKLNEAMKEIPKNGADGRGTGSASGGGKVRTVDVLMLVDSPAISPPGPDNTIRIRWEKKRMDRAALQAQIQSTERRLTAARKDSQLANLDLQNVLQKQQQTLQTLSHVSKMLHDTAMAVIRKIGG